MYRSSIDGLRLYWSKHLSATVGRYIGRLSTDSRSTVDRWLTDSRPIPDISADVSADMSTESTYSTHDPVNLMAHFILWDLKFCSLFLQHNLGTKPSLCNEFSMACGVSWRSLMEINALSHHFCVYCAILLGGP